MKQAQRTFDQVFRKLAGIFSFATILESKKGSAKVKFSDQDIQEEVQIVSPYGFHSIPTKNSRGLVLSSGDRNKSVLVAGNSEKLFLKADATPGVVQLLEEEGASLTLKDGKIFVKAESFVLDNATEGLVKLNLELLSILEEILAPGSVVVPGASPGSFKPDLLGKLKMLKQKWGV